MRITRSFYLGVYEVTQEAYEQVMGVNPSNFKGPQRPVENVSWDDAMEFCRRLSESPTEKAAGRTYRLPTEAEWEYACRAGSTTRYAYGDDDGAMGDYAWFVGNASATTHPVGQKRPNAWGLYDMHGNVWEWCADWHGEDTRSTPLDDPAGPITGSDRVYRGGSWDYPAPVCRSAYRYRIQPNFRYDGLGFRVAAVPSASPASPASPASGAARMAGPGLEQPAASPPPAPEQPSVLQADLSNSIGMAFRLIPAGEFLMGSPENQHPVRITRSLYLGVYEVTQEAYEQVMGVNPSSFKGPQRPVENVSWDDAMEFCRRLSESPTEKAAGRTYRLPTEAEWEYACRAGSTTRYAYGDDVSVLGDHGWFDANSSSTTHAVGEKRPNAWGLYDMHGNVWEWCADWYGEYTNTPLDDPAGQITGSYRVHRGGCWFSSASFCQSASRDRYQPNDRSNCLGFRVAAVPSASK